MAGATPEPAAVAMHLAAPGTGRGPNQGGWGRTPKSDSRPFKEMQEKRSLTRGVYVYYVWSPNLGPT